MRAELLGGDFVVSGPSGRVASPEELLLDSGLGPVCYEDATSPSRGISAVAANASESSATTSAAPKNYALLVASDNYKNWPHLSNPIFDAGTIEADLKKAYGFEVEHLFDPSKQELKIKLDELHQRTSDPMISFSFSSPATVTTTLPMTLVTWSLRTLRPAMITTAT